MLLFPLYSEQIKIATKDCIRNAFIKNDNIYLEPPHYQISEIFPISNNIARLTLRDWYNGNDYIFTYYVKTGDLIYIKELNYRECNIRGKVVKVDYNYIIIDCEEETPSE